jgi:hypothetical protein
MKRIVLATLALASCAPAGSPPTAAPELDPLAVSYEVHVDQATLPNVRSVRITGPDIELTEFRQGGSPNVTTLVPGRIGRIKLDIATDWAAEETTMESWRRSILTPSPALASLRRDISISITEAGHAPVVYTFQRCLPATHLMDLGAQASRMGQYWSVTCEAGQRA